MTARILAFPPPPPPRRGTIAAARPAFDREHCDGCLAVVSRGSLVNRYVDATAPGVDGWKAICRRCVRLLGEGQTFASLRPETAS